MFYLFSETKFYQQSSQHRNWLCQNSRHGETRSLCLLFVSEKNVRTNLSHLSSYICLQYLTFFESQNLPLPSSSSCGILVFCVPDFAFSLLVKAQWDLVGWHQIQFKLVLTKTQDNQNFKQNPFDELFIIIN